MKRYTAIKRTGPIKRKPPKRLSRAGSNPAYLAAIRQMRCLIDEELSPCDAPSHPHHAIYLSQGGVDTDAVPLCFKHHRQLHDHTGPFRGLSRLERFAWATKAIADTQRLYERERAA